MRSTNPSWDIPTQPAVYETESGELDSPEVRYHMDAQRLRFRAAVREFDANSALCRAADSDMQLKAAMARAGMAVHPDDIVRPADLAPHRTPTGLRDHEAGWWACGWPMAIIGLVVVIAIAAGVM
jgi:hypothetical protein